MNRITVDPQKCQKCYHCIEECPSGVLAINFGSVAEAFPELCVSCGHCAAICPHDAIVSGPANPRAFDVKTVPSSLPPDQLLFHHKRSIRNFKKEPLDQETIARLIEYAEKAPSSHNNRERRYFVITDPGKISNLEKQVLNFIKKLQLIFNPLVIKTIFLFHRKMGKELQELALGAQKMIQDAAQGKGPIFRNAPCVICIAAPSKTIQAQDDCVGAQHYMMLYGQTIGLGSCIIGYAQYTHGILEKYLKVPKGYTIFAVSIFGKPSHSYEKEVVYANPSVIWF